jgi:uncharacterized protein (TIGR03067 family)
VLVKFDDSGLGIRSELGGSGTEGIGRLQGMASLNPTVALTALADVDVELPVNGLARDLDLELLGDVGLVQGAAASGADVGQVRLVNLVDLFRAGRLAVGFGAVSFAGLAAGLLGLAGGLALGERSGLALAGAGRLIKLTVEALVLGLQFTEASLKGLAAGTRDGLHTPIIGVPRRCPAASGAVPGRGAGAATTFPRRPAEFDCPEVGPATIVGVSTPGHPAAFNERTAMRIRLLALALLPALSAFAGRGGAEDAKDKAVKDELKKLSGTWDAVSLRTGDKEIKISGSMQFVFDGDKWAIKDDGKTRNSGTLTVDPTRKPKTIDLKATKRGETGDTLLGIYELNGDELKIVLFPPGANRPADLNDQKIPVFTYKRAKP